MHAETVQALQSISVSRAAGAPMNINLSALPHAALTYANAGEDMALRKIFKRRIVDGLGGLYVDVGCAAPVSLSNTFLFYCLGWRGLCIDPNPVAPPYWKEMRPEDVFISAAVGEQEGSAKLFQHKTNLGMHQISDVLPSSEFDDVPINVPMRRLDTLFAQHIGDKAIQFMDVDVEGVELSVLRSNDWSRWRPEALIIEDHNFDMLEPRRSEVIAYLMDQGYRLDSKVANNIILLA